MQSSQTNKSVFVVKLLEYWICMQHNTKSNKHVLSQIRVSPWMSTKSGKWGLWTSFPRERYTGRMAWFPWVIALCLILERVSFLVSHDASRSSSRLRGSLPLLFHFRYWITLSMLLFVTLVDVLSWKSHWHFSLCCPWLTQDPSIVFFLLEICWLNQSSPRMHSKDIDAKCKTSWPEKVSLPSTLAKSSLRVCCYLADFICDVLDPFFS